LFENTHGEEGTLRTSSLGFLNYAHKFTFAFIISSN